MFITKEELESHMIIDRQTGRQIDCDIFDSSSEEEEDEKEELNAKHKKWFKKVIKKKDLTEKCEEELEFHMERKHE